MEKNVRKNPKKRFSNWHEILQVLKQPSGSNSSLDNVVEMAVAKWKQKVIQMNLRKAVIFFIVTSFVLIIASSAAVYGNFQSRMNEWEKFTEADREHEEGDLALIAGCGIIGMVVGVWYWVLVLIAVYRKSCRMGVNTTLWTLAAFVFNLAALAVLYLYAMLKGTCPNCGRVRSSSGRFCDRCGNLLKKECPQCRQQIYHLPIAVTVVKNWMNKEE